MPENKTSVSESNLPVSFLPREAPSLEAEEKGIALCLSGGGYRAMLFHAGALIRLNELGYLPKIDRVSSVSGGSITAGVLALNWNKLTFDQTGVATNLMQVVIEPIRKMASKTIDASSIIEGVLLPGSVAEHVAGAYREYLFGHATLQDLPDRPRFVINATNVQSGVLWRFSKPYMWDYRVGKVENSKTELAIAVGASSAFPPVLSPVEMKLDPASFTAGTGEDLQREPFTSDVILTDGGVYDNLGLETAFKRYSTVLVSDGGGGLAAEAEPKKDWARHAYRVLNIIDSQVRALRVRQLIDAYEAGIRGGGYWGIRSDIRRYTAPGVLNCPFEKTIKIADTPTRLKRLEEADQNAIMDWGYAICDAGMRMREVPSAKPPSGSPYGTFSAAKSASQP